MQSTLKRLKEKKMYQFPKPTTKSKLVCDDVRCEYMGFPRSTGTGHVIGSDMEHSRITLHLSVRKQFSAQCKLTVRNLSEDYILEIQN